MNNINQFSVKVDEININQGQHIIDQNLYHGVRVEQILNNDLLPVGGSLFSEKIRYLSTVGFGSIG